MSMHSGIGATLFDVAMLLKRLRQWYYHQSIIFRGEELADVSVDDEDLGIGAQGWHLHNHQFSKPRTKSFPPLTSFALSKICCIRSVELFGGL